METKNEDQKAILFAVELIPTKEEIREYIAHVFYKGYTLFGCAFSIAVILLGFWFDFLIIALVCSVVGLLNLQIAKYWKSRKAIEAFERLASTGYEGWRSVFYEDVFKSDNNTFCYEQIAKIVVGKLCLYIIIEKTLLVIIRKDAFTVGDYESFVAFLREKLKDNPAALWGLK